MLKISKSWQERTSYAEELCGDPERRGTSSQRIKEFYKSGKTGSGQIIRISESL